MLPHLAIAVEMGSLASHRFKQGFRQLIEQIALGTQHLI